MQRHPRISMAQQGQFVEEEKKNAKGFVIGAKFTVPGRSSPTSSSRRTTSRPGCNSRRRISLAWGGILTVPAQEVTDEMLEDFAKALIGQQSEIRKYRVQACRNISLSAARELQTLEHHRDYLRSISSIL